MRLARQLIALAFASLPMLSHADYCSDAPWKEQVGTSLGHKRLQEDLEDHWSRCDILPGKTPRAVVLLAYPAAEMNPQPKFTGDPLTAYEIEVALVDAKSGKVLSRDQYKRPMQANRSGLQGIEFFANKFTLAPGVTSVGIRLQHAGPSPRKLESFETLSLYAIENDKLRKVLDRQPVWSVVGDWDEQCNGTYTETRTLVKAAPARKGFADLSLRTTEDSRSAVQKGPRCVETKKKPIATTSTMKYDGSVYPTQPRT